MIGKTKPVTQSLKEKDEFQKINDKGILLSSEFLSESDTLLNNNKNFHLLKPLSNVFAFIENTIGPFKKDKLEFLHEMKSKQKMTLFFIFKN